MISAMLKTAVGEHLVTRGQLLAAMKEFDLQFRVKEEDTGTMYAVEEDGKRYPPKRLLAIATGVPVGKFYGGERSNKVFQRLRFKVLRIAENQRAWKTAEEIAAEKARMKLPVPRIEKLVDGLFRKKWVPLREDYSKLVDSDHPGVYVLAYSAKELRGKPVKEDQIYYVGVSHAGVRKRLKQFIKGLKDGGLHSAAKKFFSEVAHGVPYSSLPDGKEFFVSSISVPCTYSKKARNPLDLQKLGLIAALEWYVLARVRKKTGDEPWLNTK